MASFAIPVCRTFPSCQKRCVTFRFLACAGLRARLFHFVSHLPQKRCYNNSSTCALIFRKHRRQNRTRRLPMSHDADPFLSYLTIEEAAQELELAASSIRRMIAEDRLPAKTASP